MIERVRLTPQATRDLREARQWYDARRKEWGKVFLKRVGECMRAIQEMPRRFPAAQGEIRRARVRQFSYEVMFGYSASPSPAGPGCAERRRDRRARRRWRGLFRADPNRTGGASLVIRSTLANPLANGGQRT
jgi:hypothetical protein